MPEVKKDEGPGRSVRISVGKKKYAVYTRLDEETCASVVSLVQGIVEKMPFGVSQEEKLLLACLRLALSVHRSAKLLGGPSTNDFEERRAGKENRGGTPVEAPLAKSASPENRDVPTGLPLSPGHDAEVNGEKEPGREVENL